MTMGLMNAEALAEGDQRSPADPQRGGAASASKDFGIEPCDLLEYVATFSTDFAELAHGSGLFKLALLLDIVAAEAERERERAKTSARAVTGHHARQA